MKITYLETAFGAGEPIVAGTEVTLKKDEATRLIAVGRVKAVDEKEHKKVLDEIADKKEAENQKSRDLEALLQKDELEIELNTLLKRTQEIMEILGAKNIVIVETDLTIEQIQQFEADFKEVEKEVEKEVTVTIPVPKKIMDKAKEAAEKKANSK